MKAFLPRAGRVLLAAATTAVLTATLTACGGGGGGSTDSGTPVTPVTPTTNTLFAAVPTAGSIATFADVNPTAGSTAAGRTMTALSGLGSTLAYDAANDRLYATRGLSVLVFDKASTAGGVYAPTRSFTPSSSGLFAFSSVDNLAYDKASDTLYLAGTSRFDGVLAIISHASTASGTVAPDHAYPVQDTLRSFALDTQRKLVYAIGVTPGVVNVYDLAQLLDTPPGGGLGANLPVRSLSFAGSTIGSGVAIDMARDRLYAVDAQSQRLVVLNNASTASGSVAFEAVALPTNAGKVTFDAAHDRLYVGLPGAATIINGASTLASGSTLPAAVTLTTDAGSAALQGFAFPQ